MLFRFISDLEMEKNKMIKDKSCFNCEYSFSKLGYYCFTDKNIKCPYPMNEEKEIKKGLERT